MLTLSFTDDNIIIGLELDEPQAKRVRIEDYGEHIGGARKDTYANTMFSLSAITQEQLSESKHLNDLMTIPNFAQMYREGSITKEQACAAYAMWRCIPKRTQRRSYSWAYTTYKVLQKVNELLDDYQGDYGEYLMDYQESAFHEYNTLLAAGYPDNEFSFGNYRVSTHLWYDFKADKQDNAYCIITIGNRAHYISRYLKTYEDVVSAMKDLLAERSRNNKKASADDGEVKPVELKYWRSRMSGLYYCTPKKKSQRDIHLMEWETRAEMEEFMSDETLRIPIYKKYWDMVNIPNERHSLNRPRIGEQWLEDGKDLMPADLADAFPFRGIEFGNWVTQEQRAAFLNDTYVAMKDMLTVLDITPENITCNKDLAIAFGARGRGNFAVAHYEPLRRVINLTKTRGAGSLAHEWFHAIDRLASGDQCLLTERNSLYAPDKPLYMAAYRLVSKMRSLNYGKRCGKVDALKDKKYWSKPCEMAARAFEAIVIELLAARGWRSDFLASITPYESWPDKTTYVYPTPTEMKELAPFFDRFLQELFHSPSFMTAEVIAHFDCLAEHFKAA